MQSIDFQKTTPHFFGLKLKFNENTALYKNIPEGILEKTKGHINFMKMRGRDKVNASLD